MWAAIISSVHVQNSERGFAVIFYLTDGLLQERLWAGVEEDGQFYLFSFQHDTKVKHVSLITAVV